MSEQALAISVLKAYATVYSKVLVKLHFRLT
jgi:hypothetical protein